MTSNRSTVSFPDLTEMPQAGKTPNELFPAFTDSVLDTCAQPPLTHQAHGLTTWLMPAEQIAAERLAPFTATPDPSDYPVDGEHGVQSAWHIQNERYQMEQTCFRVMRIKIDKALDPTVVSACAPPNQRNL